MKNLLSFSSSNPNIILIGAGTQWDVYRYHNEQRVHGQESLVIKVPIHNSRDIKKNIENYNLIKSFASTASFLEECLFDESKALVTDDLSANEIIYISSNSYFIQASDRRMIQAGIKNKADFQVISRAEQYISEHPINNILNLEKLLLMMISMLETASRNGISLFFDCYFWGLNKNESDVTLTYIIADWDCIHKVSHQYNKLLCYNLENLQSSIIGFIQEFVVEENQNYYKNLIWQLFEDRIKQEQYI